MKLSRLAQAVLWSALILLLQFKINAGTAESTSNNNFNGADTLKNHINDITVTDMQGNEIEMSEYNGNVLLIVNVASKCGYTPQYEGLQAIYEKYESEGFEILAFPCNDFGGQEPGTNEEIKEFCTTNYSVTFKLFDKIKVLGEEKHPLYERLTNNPVTDKSDIGWNFEKFLISKEGEIIKRYPSKVKPESELLTNAIEKELAK